MLKLIYLHLAYWFVGLPEELFYSEKGRYLVELNAHDEAIKSYKEAFRNSNDRHTHAMLDAMIGYCHSRSGDHQAAVTHYRKAYKNINDSSVDMGLALSEFEVGNIDESEAIVRDLRASKKLSTATNERLANLDMRIALVRRERKRLEEHNRSDWRGIR